MSTELTLIAGLIGFLIGGFFALRSIKKDIDKAFDKALKKSDVEEAIRKIKDGK